MEEQNNKYANSKIYIIRSIQTEKIYIGSTTKKLTTRMSLHKSSYKAWKNDTTKNYYTSYEVLKYEDAYIELLEALKCDTKDELRKREGVLILEQTANVVNKVVAGRNKKDSHANYRANNKDKLKEYNANRANKMKQYNVKYNAEHKDKIKQQKAKYRAEHADQIKQYQAEYQAEYQAKNKNHIKQQKAEYYQKQKKKLAQSESESE